MILFRYLLPGCERPTLWRKSRHRKRKVAQSGQIEESTSDGGQFKYPETRLSPCSLRPRAEEDNISNLDLISPTDVEKSVLNRLPLELRLMIYSYVLGRDKNLLILTPFKMRALRDESWSPVFKSVLDAVGNGAVITREDRRFWPQRTALLRTSRQVYTEAVELLYTGNTFVIRHSEMLSRLSKSIPPQRFNTIRSISVHWTPWQSGILAKWENREPWCRLWELIASMENLSILEVNILDWQPLHEGNSNYTHLIEPISELRGLQEFVLNARQVRYQWDHRPYDSPMNEIEIGIQESTKVFLQHLEETVKLPRGAEGPLLDMGFNY